MLRTKARAYGFGQSRAHAAERHLGAVTPKNVIGLGYGCHFVGCLTARIEGEDPV
jgi:hypothetical protein